MNKINTDALHVARGVLLTFRKQTADSLQRAFALLLEHEEPEMMAMDRRGAGGLFEWYKFKQVGLLVERRDGRIIEVREKKF